MIRILIILSLISSIALSQEIVIEQKSVEECHKTLKILVKKLYKSKSDDDKRIINQEILAEFEKALEQPNSFEFAFDSIKQDIHILTSDDNKFRIINWEIPFENGTYQYFGFIQSKFNSSKKRRKKNIVIQLYPLIDRTSEISNHSNHIGDNKKWLGMWYYKIITKTYKSKTYYTLLAWNGNDKYSQKKIIDVLTFDANGTPKFGANIFNYGKSYPKRVIFEYSKTCTMSLKYNSNKDSIIFDHLAPTNPLLEGQFQYYCTDMSYDGFGFNKGKWYYGVDINAINEKNDKDKLYNDPKKLKDIKTNESDIIIEKKKKKTK